MSVEKITEKILSDAREQAGRIEKEFADRIGQIHNRRDQQVEEIRSRAKEEARQRAQDRFQKDIATAELELRKEVLARKQELIRMAFDRARKEMMEMKGSARRDFLLQLLLQSVESGEEEVIVSSQDESLIDEKFLEQANKQLEKNGKTGRLRLSGDHRDLPGGFVLRRSKQETNCSFGALIHSVRQELEPDVAGRLFPQSG
jgi:V/A-type H+-transporting ATPase subunit E